MFSNLILGLSLVNVVITHSKNELERKSASLDIAEDQMFSNLILRLCLVNVHIRHCDNEVKVLNAMGGMKRVLELGVGFRDNFEKILSHHLDY
jgi:hypothetical protein